MRVLAWRGIDVPRFELAFVSLEDDRLTARGTQIGVEPEPYRLHYAVEAGAGFVSNRLQVDVETASGLRSLDLRRGMEPLVDDVLDLDLGYSPVFNSLPILRHRLHQGGQARELVMAWVSVPELAVQRSAQRYVPLGAGLVRYRSGSFTADLELDEEGFVVRYPQLAERVFPPPGENGHG